MAHGAPATIQHVVCVMLSATGMGGVSVTLTLDAGGRETVYACDGVASELAESALMLGEGPSLDAGAGGPVLVEDLTGEDSAVLWPAFSVAAAMLGARAVVALPLQVGAIRLGASISIAGSLAGSLEGRWTTRWRWPIPRVVCLLT